MRGLPKKYKENIIKKFFNKIVKKIRSKKKPENKTQEVKEKKDNKGMENLKINVDLNSIKLERDKREFMENLKENMELLDSFSNEKLEIILKWYADENERLRKKLKLE